MSYVGYLFFRLIVFVFGLLPFFVIYIISDFLAWMLHSVFGYRKKVVYTQLKTSFPNKTEGEINAIVKASYKNLADIIVESIKGFTMDEKVFRERYVMVNPELANAYHRQGKSMVHIAAHYNNWEWGAMTYPLWIENPVLGFYKPLSNHYMEAYGKRQRGKFNMNLIPIGETALAFEKYKNQATSFVFVSDQSTWSDKAHWVTFLGQDTACPPGADKYARLIDAVVFYVDINRISRGYYQFKLELLSLDSNKKKEGEITKLFMERLETQLLENPENWLWSHKRWKKKRENV